MTAQQCTKDTEWNRHKHPQEEEFEQYQEGDVVDGLVAKSDEIQHGENAHEDGWEQKYCQRHGQLPLSRSRSTTIGPARRGRRKVKFEVTSRGIPSHNTTQRIKHQYGMQYLPTFLMDFP